MYRLPPGHRDRARRQYPSQGDGRQRGDGARVLRRVVCCFVLSFFRCLSQYNVAPRLVGGSRCNNICVVVGAEFFSTLTDAERLAFLSKGNVVFCRAEPQDKQEVLFLCSFFFVTLGWLSIDQEATLTHV